MTELPTPPEASDGTDIPLSESLISYIVSMLAPMFLCAGSGDVRLARMAALEILSAYRMQNQADLMTVAQVVAFGIATLGSLSQSMLDDLSLPTVLRLRGSANALSRSGHRHQQMLQQSHRAPERRQAPPNEVARQLENLFASEDQEVAPPAHVQPPADAPQPELREQEPAAPAAPLTASINTTPQPTPEPVTAAAQPFPDIPSLPSMERRPPTMRAAALGSTASALFTNLQDSPAEGRYRAVSPSEPVPAPQPPAPSPRSAPPPR